MDGHQEEGRLEELNIEQFSQQNAAEAQKPRAQFYVIRVDRETRRVAQEQLTGAEILDLVGKTVETHKLFQRFKGGRTDVVQPSDVVSFVAPGVERFQTIPRDTCEGGGHE